MQLGGQGGVLEGLKRGVKIGAILRGVRLEGNYVVATAVDESDDIPAEPEPDACEALVDWQEALRVVEGDEGLLCELIRESLTELPELMERLERDLKNGDAPQAYRHAHTTKAAGRTFGIPALLKQAEQTEEAAANGDLETVSAQLPVLREIVSQALLELEQRLKHEV